MAPWQLFYQINVEFDGACIMGVGDLGIVSAFSADDPNESCRVSASSNLDDDAGEDDDGRSLVPRTTTNARTSLHPQSRFRRSK